MEQSLVFKKNLSERDFQELSGQSKKRTEIMSNIYENMNISFSPVFHPAGFEVVQDPPNMGIEEEQVNSDRLPTNDVSNWTHIQSVDSTFLEQPEESDDIEETRVTESESTIPAPPTSLSKWIELVVKLGKLVGLITGGFAGLDYLGIL